MALPNNLAAIGSLTGYRAMRWGANVELIITDQRSYRSEEPSGMEEASPLSTQTTPTKGGVTSDVASADSAGSNVVVAGDRAASTVVRKLRISPDGKLLALGDEEGFVRVIRLDTFEVIATIPAHGGRISDLDFSPDSGILLSAGRDRLLRFWDVNTAL